MNIPSSPDTVAAFRNHLRQTIEDLERDMPGVENLELLAALQDLYKAHIALLAELNRRYPEAPGDAVLRTEPRPEQKVQVPDRS